MSMRPISYAVFCLKKKSPLRRQVLPVGQSSPGVSRRFTVGGGREPLELRSKNPSHRTKTHAPDVTVVEPSPDRLLADAQRLRRLANRQETSVGFVGAVSHASLVAVALEPRTSATWPRCAPVAPQSPSETS